MQHPVATWAADPHEPVGLCPRCAYYGPGSTFFSRGRNVAKLVGVTVLTSGIIGAGGIAYYLLRRDHRLCPHCGKKWGAMGRRAGAMQFGAMAQPTDVLLGSSEERGARGGALILFIFALVMLAVGMTTLQAAPFVTAAAFAVGGFLAHRAEGTKREERRRALIAALQPAVLSLAGRVGGRLTVTQTAAALRWPLPRAEKVLQSLDDGMRVDSTVSDAGVIVYDFREVVRAPRVGELPGGGSRTRA